MMKEEVMMLLVRGFRERDNKKMKENDESFLVNKDNNIVFVILWFFYKYFLYY